MPIKSTKPLKVGFDLDGVLLYNPARIIRPFLKTAKKLVLKQNNPSFYIPKSRWEQFMWRLAHMTSFIPAPGNKDITYLVKTGKIDATIITARFMCLKKDYKKWVNRLNRQSTFHNSFYNHKDLQPHKYKLDLINKLKLDVFVEDNWDIVSHLTKHAPKTKVLWVSNIFDNKIDYPHKYASLKKAVAAIKDMVN